jgi:hypothetical protein
MHEPLVDAQGMHEPLVDAQGMHEPERKLRCRLELRGVQDALVCMFAMGLCVFVCMRACAYKSLIRDMRKIERDFLRYIHIYPYMNIFAG